MTLILDKKALLLTSLLLLMLTFWWMKVSIDSSSASTLMAVTSLQTAADIIQQITEENADATASGGDHNRPSLKDEIERAKHRLPRKDYKAAKSNYQRMTEHIDKLEKYKQDPLRFDNQGLLRNAPNDHIRQKIIESRIAHLEQEIQTFYNNIIKIIN